MMFPVPISSMRNYEEFLYYFIKGSDYKISSLKEILIENENN